MQPILIKLGLTNGELFAILHQQALIEIQQNSFCGISHITTIIGQKPEQ
jgi:hypothetical protein